MRINARTEPRLLQTPAFGWLAVWMLGCSWMGCSPMLSSSTGELAARAEAADANAKAGQSDASSEELPSLWTRTRGEDWPRMLGVHFDSRSSETGIRTDWGTTGLRIVWTQKTGTGYGNGVAAKGRWFQFDRFGSVERLSCYNAETGEFLWKHETPVSYSDAYGYNDGPRCSPVVEGQHVFTYGVAGNLTCIDIATQKVVWSRDMNSDYGVVPNFFGVGASPVVHGPWLLVMVGGSPKPTIALRSPNVNDLPSAKPDGTGIVALDRQTGKEVFRVGNYLASYSAPIVAKLEGKDHCLALMREGLLVFPLDDPKAERFFPWRAAMLESVNAASPVVFDDRIFISEAYEIGSALLQWKGGELQPLWKDSGGRSSQAMRTHWATPLFDNGFLYASSGRNQPDTDLRCIEVFEDAPPKVRWTQRNRDRGTGLLVDGHFLWLGENGRLQLIPLGSEKFNAITEMDLQSMVDPTDKQPLVQPPSWAPPVLSHGLLYVRGADRVICLELIPQS